jgi:hypothetical protein
MKADRRRWWFVIGVAGLVVTAACGGGDGADVAGVSRTDPGASTTAVQPAVTEPGVVEPGREDPTTKVAHEPVYVDGVAQVTASPTRGQAGTRVRLDGYGFTGDPWQTGGGTLWLVDARPEADCLAIAEAENDLGITADGHLSGTFVVPVRGGCRFGAGEIDTGPLAYDIAFQCSDCRIGSFNVILAGESMEEPAGTPCEGNVVFGVQNFADEIYADGLSCDEAVDFIRDHAAPLRAVTGPAHVEGGGFACDRTGQSEAALPPRANYKCTGAGSRTIWFLRH